MSFDAGAVTSTIGIDVSPFATGMLQATAIARLFPETVADFLANPLLGLVDIAEKATDAIKEAFFDVSQSAHELGIQAQQAGVSAEFLEKIGAAAKESGVNTEGLAHSLAFLARNAQDAAHGNEQTYLSFARLGVSIFDTGGHLKSTQQLFLDVADAIARLKGTGLDTVGAMDLMSREGIEMLPLLHRGSAGIADLAETMEKASGGMSGNLVQISDSATHLGSVWDSVWEGVHRSLATPVLEVVAAHADQLQDAAIAAGQAMRTGIGDAFAFVGDNAGRVVSAFGSIQSTLASATAFVREHAAAFIGALAPIGAFLLSSTVLGAIAVFGGAVSAVFAAIVSPLGIAIAAFSALGAAVGTARLKEGFEAAVAGIRQGVEWIASTAIPVLRTDLTSAFNAAVPYAVAFGQSMENAWQSLKEGITWVRGTAVPVIQTELAGAWAFVAPAVQSAVSISASALRVFQDIGRFIGVTLVPVIGQALTTAWAGLSPIVAAAREQVAAIWPVLLQVDAAARHAFEFLAGAAVQALFALFGQAASTSNQLASFADFCVFAGHAVGVVLSGAIALTTPIFRAFGNAIAEGVRLMTDFIKFVIDAGAAIDKLTPKLSSIYKYTAAASTFGISLLMPSPFSGGQSTGNNNAASPVSASWNALAAPGTTNPIPSVPTTSSGASNALSGSLSPAAVVANNSLQVMNDSASSFNDQLQSLSSTLNQLNPQFTSLVNASASPSQSVSTSSPAASSATTRPTVSINGGINIDTNANDTSNQIAAKLKPIIADAYSRLSREIASKSAASLSKGGL